MVARDAEGERMGRFVYPIIFVCLNAILAATDLRGATIHVPQEQPTIQAGIDAAGDGDTVLVGAGVYVGDGNRDIDYYGLMIVVCGEQGMDNTIIDCQGTDLDPHRGFSFTSGEDSNSVLIGFTVRHGFTPSDDHYLSGGWEYSYLGGGVLCWHASPLIIDCRIADNLAGSLNDFNDISGGAGGGIGAQRSSVIMRHCVVEGNRAAYGAGICLSQSSAIIDSCLIQQNYGVAEIPGGTWNPQSEGARVWMSRTPAILQHSAAVQNYVHGGGGGFPYSKVPGYTSMAHRIRFLES